MDHAERQKLQNQYRSFTDAQLLSMLADGPQEYVEGAYGLLVEEARRRGLEPGQQEPQGRPAEQEAAGLERSDNPTAFAQIAIINSEEDRSQARSVLEAGGIDYIFQNLHLDPDIGLPAGLLVDEARVSEAISALKDFKPRSSILLW